ncbi:hypothetical protein BC831DRAFT_93596 [Entophlyctis helioformis]|nr:hypothetical protein BC831DRAFT_93596 [Entophlyctis helioformis]
MPQPFSPAESVLLQYDCVSSGLHSMLIFSNGIASEPDHQSGIDPDSQPATKPCKDARAQALDSRRVGLPTSAVDASRAAAMADSSSMQECGQDCFARIPHILSSHRLSKGALSHQSDDVHASQVTEMQRALSDSIPPPPTGNGDLSATNTQDNSTLQMPLRHSISSKTLDPAANSYDSGSSSAMWTQSQGLDGGCLDDAAFSLFNDWLPIHSLCGLNYGPTFPDQQEHLRLQQEHHFRKQQHQHEWLQHGYECALGLPFMHYSLQPSHQYHASLPIAQSDYTSGGLHWGESEQARVAAMAIGQSSGSPLEIMQGVMRSGAAEAVAAPSKPLAASKQRQCQDKSAGSFSSTDARECAQGQMACRQAPAGLGSQDSRDSRRAGINQGKQPGSARDRAKELARKRPKQVGKACVHCKKAHLACDQARPCGRCARIGKADCVDVVHKPRGRPKLSTSKPAPQSGRGYSSQDMAVVARGKVAHTVTAAVHVGDFTQTILGDPQVYDGRLLVSLAAE